MFGAFQNNNFVGDNFCGAAEYWYKEMFALRGSWFGTVNSVSNPITGEGSSTFASGDDLYSGIALGGTANIVTGPTKLGVDAVWRPAREFFDDIFEVGVRVKF
jgi:hypothetical protein